MLFDVVVMCAVVFCAWLCSLFVRCCVLVACVLLFGFVACDRVPC